MLTVALQIFGIVMAAVAIGFAISAIRHANRASRLAENARRASNH